MKTLDEVGEQLAGWGKVARIETHGRMSGRPAVAAVGYVAEPDGALLVVAGSPEADWARNLEVDPACRVEIEGQSFDAAAEPLAREAAARAIVALIIKYGTPAERLGRGPAFRLRPRATSPGRNGEERGRREVERGRRAEERGRRAAGR